MENTTQPTSTSPAPAAASTTAPKKKSNSMMMIIIVVIALVLCCVGTGVAAYVFRDKLGLGDLMSEEGTPTPTATDTPTSTEMSPTPTESVTPQGSGTPTVSGSVTPTPSRSASGTPTPTTTTSGPCPTASGQAQGTWPNDSGVPAYSKGNVCVSTKSTSSDGDVWSVTIANTTAADMTAYFNSLKSSGWEVMDGGESLGAWIASKDKTDIGASASTLRGKEVFVFVITKGK